MSAFADLWRHFPKKMAELCLEEAFVERRPLYYFDEGEPYSEQRPVCRICGGVAIFNWRDDRWLEYCDPPIPDITQDTCADPKCEELFVWINLQGREGNRRRRAYCEKFGDRWYMGEPGEDRATRLSLVMLEFTIRETKNEADCRRAA